MIKRTRLLAEKIQEINGESLFIINLQANRLVQMGLVADREEGLEYLLSITEDLADV